MKKIQSMALMLGLVFLVFAAGCDSRPPEPVAGPGVTVTDADTVSVPVTKPRWKCGMIEQFKDPALTGSRDSSLTEEILVADSLIQAAGYRWAGPAGTEADTSLTAGQRRAAELASDNSGIGLSWLGWLLAVLAALILIAVAVWLLVWIFRNLPQRQAPAAVPGRAGSGAAAGNPNPPAGGTPQGGAGGATESQQSAANAQPQQTAAPAGEAPLTSEEARLMAQLVADPTVAEASAGRVHFRRHETADGAQGTINVRQQAHDNRRPPLAEVAEE